MAKKLTKRQLEVLRAISLYIDQNGHAPTLRDVARNTLYRSPSRVWEHMNSLRNMGLLRWRPGKQRTLEITPAGRDELVPVGGVNIGHICQTCGAHYFGPACPFERCHEEAVGW